MNAYLTDTVTYQQRVKNEVVEDAARTAPNLSFCIIYDSVTVATLAKGARVEPRSLMARDTTISSLFGAVTDFSPLSLWSRGQTCPQ